MLIYWYFKAAKAEDEEAENGADEEVDGQAVKRPAEEEVCICMFFVI